MSPPIEKCILREVATMTKTPEPNSKQSKNFFIAEILSLGISGNGIRSNMKSVNILKVLTIQTNSSLSVHCPVSISHTNQYHP